MMEGFYILLLVTGTACAVPGGWNEVDVNDTGVQDAANFGAVEIDSRSNSLFKSRLLTVLKAETQVIFTPFGIAKGTVTCQFGGLPFFSVSRPLTGCEM